jgi:hypothetical protein
MYILKMKKYEFKKLHKIKWKKFKRPRQKAFKKNKVRTIVRKRNILKKLRSVLPYRFSKFFLSPKKHTKYWHDLKIIFKFFLHKSYLIKKSKLIKRKILKKNELIVDYWPRLMGFPKLELPVKIILKRTSRYWTYTNKKKKQREKLKGQLMKVKKDMKKLSKKRSMFDEKFIELKSEKKKKLRKKNLILFHFKAFWMVNRYFFKVKIRQKNKEKMWERFLRKYRVKVISKKKKYGLSKLKFRKLYKWVYKLRKKWAPQRYVKNFIYGSTKIKRKFRKTIDNTFLISKKRLKDKIMLKKFLAKELLIKKFNIFLLPYEKFHEKYNNNLIFFLLQLKYIRYIHKSRAAINRNIVRVNEQLCKNVILNPYDSVRFTNVKFFKRFTKKSFKKKNKKKKHFLAKNFIYNTQKKFLIVLPTQFALRNKEARKVEKNFFIYYVYRVMNSMQ